MWVEGWIEVESHVRIHAKFGFPFVQSYLFLEKMAQPLFADGLDSILPVPKRTNQIDDVHGQQNHSVCYIFITL